MKFSKSWAFLFLMGLLIHTIVVPSAPITASSATPEDTRGPAGRGSLPTISQESESIDSFNVHPANRWSDVSSGTFAEDLENGEFSIQAFDNTSSSNLRYRDAETTSGDIEARWRLNTTDSDAVNASADIEAALIGLNVTTDEGSGNSSLNAYYFNSTHYVVRPTFTTEDGSLWRSWNIESDYQDYMQQVGIFGADGIDFLEGTVEQSTNDLIGDTIQQGWFRGQAVAAVNDLNIFQSPATLSLDPLQYEFLDVKYKFNGSATTDMLIIASPGNLEISGQTFINDDQWHKATLNLTTDANWDDNARHTRIILRSRAAPHGANDFWWIDHIRFYSNNDTSDLTFFSYEEYYRAQMKYDLMESTLSWKISDDADQKLTSAVQGQFKIEDFFEPAALIRDISLGEVGDISYLFGLRSAGANATVWWDFYLADFQEFLWTFQSKTETGNLWTSLDPYSAYMIGNGSVGTSLTQAWQIIVPEFDAASGRLVLEEPSDDENTGVGINFEIESVTAATGAFAEEIKINFGDVLHAAVGDPHNLSVDIDTVTESEFQADGGTDDSGRISFTINFDKVRRQLSLQIQYLDAAGIERSIGYSANVAAGQSNEMKIQVTYVTGIGGAGAGTEETHAQLQDFEFTFRDIFGIPLPGPDIGENPLPKDPIGFLIQAFRDLAGLMGTVFDQLVANGLVMASVATILVTFAADVAIANATMVASLGSIVTNTANTVTNVATVITNTAGLVADFTQLLLDTSSMVTDLGDLGAILTGVADLPQDFIDLLTDTGNIFSTLGDIFDELVDALGDSWLGQIFDILFGLAIDFASEIIGELIAEAIAVLAAVLDAMISYFRDITVSGVSIGDVIDLIDAWMVNFWNIADDIISLGIEILTVWTQVFLMGLLGIILIWAAASAKQDGALFTEKFTAAMNYNVNPIGFILTLRIPLGVILLGNLFFVVFAAYDWAGFLIPGVVMANFHLGAAYEIPDFSEQMDVFFDFMQAILDDIIDTLLNEVAGGAWKTLVTLLSDDILGASPEIIVFVVTAGVAATILLRGQF